STSQCSLASLLSWTTAGGWGAQDVRVDDPAILTEQLESLDFVGQLQFLLRQLEDTPLKGTWYLKENMQCFVVETGEE
ncbi:unnamed protein product, partial [Amoebophrya sp. A25]